MTTDMHNGEQTIAKNACPAVPDVGYALRTFRIDLERWCLLPVGTMSRSSWDGRSGHSSCEVSGHLAPQNGCGCGIYGQRSLRELRSAHPQAASLVAVMKYDPSFAIEDGNEVRAMFSEIVAYWISPDLPVRWLAEAIVHDLTEHLCVEYDDLDCMLARYQITESADPSIGPDGQARKVSATDGVVTLPCWAGALGLPRTILTARAVRSWAAVMGPALRVSFSGAWSYATVTARAIVATMLIALGALGLHYYIRTHVTHVAWIDPVLLAGHELINAIATPPVLRTVMAALGLLAAIATFRQARPLPSLSDPRGWRSADV